MYKSNVTDKENGNEFLNNLNIPRFSEEQKQSCEKEIFAEAITAILNSVENNKSPGNDKIPIEFYKSCWELISDPFMECVRECFDHGEMSSSQRKEIITLMEKQHKDRTLIENWRPISLINVDAKIISKVIALRLKKVLPNIIHHNKTGGGETVRSIFDIMEFADSKNIPGILIFIDFKKAFDS